MDDIALRAKYKGIQNSTYYNNSTKRINAISVSYRLLKSHMAYSAKSIEFTFIQKEGINTFRCRVERETT